MKERNAGTTGKSPNQDLASAKDQIIMLPEGRASL